MICHSIGDLAQLACGRVRLAALPPIGGLCEPLRRVQPEIGSIQPGDVYWPLGPATEPIDQAFARGALGVVYDESPVEPWAGRFSLQVRSITESLLLAAARAGELYPGNLVAIACDSPATAGHLNRRLGLALPNCRVSCANSEFELARAVIHLDEHWPLSVFTFYRQATDQSNDRLRGLATEITANRGDSIAECSRQHDLNRTVAMIAELAEQTKQREPCKALPSMLDLRESGMPTLLGRSDNLADRWHLGRPPWQVLPGRA